MSWFGPKNCNCPCAEPPPPPPPDPCNCTEDTTYYIKIELIDFISERIVRNGSFAQCPCAIVAKYYLSEINGTYFLALTRNCIDGVPRFTQTVGTTFTLATGNTNTSHRNAPGCTLVDQGVPTKAFATIEAVSSTQITISFNVVPSPALGALFTVPLVIPTDLCTGNVAEDLGASGNVIRSNVNASCTGFNETLGSWAWSIVPEPPP